ncbi:hypothetical protein [Marmoricola sp. URHA0025 HA25]
MTAALQADAEDAMNRINTTEKLQSFIEASSRDARRRRRVQAAAALATVAAAAVAAVVVSWPGRDAHTAPPVTNTQQVTEAEQVAGDFLEALAAFDRDGAATYVADGAQLTMGNVMGDDTVGDAWTLRNRWDEATGWKVTDIAGCHESSVRLPDIDVRCVFTAHQLGSDQLGRGPFGDNVLALTVRDRVIVDATLTTAHNTNGFSDTMWDPFWIWMEVAHPNDEQLMAAFENPAATPARVTRSLNLWQQRIQQYVGAVQAGLTQ